MRCHQVVVLTAVGALVIGLAGSDVAGAAGSGAVGKVHTLTTGAASLLDTVVPLTGSPHELVYAQQSQQTAGLSNPIARVPAFSVFARSQAGKEVPLGTLPSPAPSGWSMSGDTVTATRGRDVFVYSASTGERHVVTLMAGARYVAAAPGGFVYGDGATLSRHNPSGADTSLGQPAGAGASVLSGASSAAGVVVTDDAESAAYVPFSDPTHPVTLDIGGAEAVQCGAVSATAAGCLGDAEALYVPLNGSPSTVVDPDFDTGGVALAGDVVIFGESADSGPDARIHSFEAGSTTVADSTGTYQDENNARIISAYDAAIVTPSELAPKRGLPTVPAPVDTATSATDVSTLFPTPHSPVTAAAFSLANGRVAYTADPAAGARSGALVTVLSRRLMTHRVSVSISAPIPVARRAGTGISTSRLVAAGGAATVDAYGSRAHGTDAVGLRVISPHHNAKIPVLNLNSLRGTVELSGHRLLYSAAGFTYLVDNVNTGHSKVVHAGRSDHRVALAGRYLAYASRHGAIYRKNVVTGKTVRLAKARPSYSGPVAVYASGRWVGWEYGRSGGASWLRNAGTMAKTTRLPHPLYSLTSAGALLDTTNTAAFDRGSIGVSRTRVWLRSYSGHVRTLLSPRAFVAGPQISGGVVAWISAAGNLEVARLSG